jgi:hypothetical protein
MARLKYKRVELKQYRALFSSEMVKCLQQFEQCNTAITKTLEEVSSGSKAATCLKKFATQAQGLILANLNEREENGR